MSAQPEALLLADLWEKHSHGYARTPEARTAAELRRLHQFAEDQIGRATAAEAALQMTKATHALKLAAVEAQRDALLEVVQKYIAWSEAENDHKGTTFWERVEMCREVDELADAAIKAVEGNT